MVVRIDHRDLAAGLERDEHEHAVAVERRRARQARVVVVDPGAEGLRVRRKIDAGADRPTVFWKFRLAPLRSVPRLMLSFLDGTQAELPSGEITAGPR